MITDLGLGLEAPVLGRRDSVSLDLETLLVLGISFRPHALALKVQSLTSSPWS